MSRCPLLFVLLSLCCGCVHAESRLNVLFVYVDDLGYGDLGSYGHPVIQTPHLDQLAASGMRLTNYYAPSALCSPSRAAVLTGRHPYRTGIKSWIPQDSNVYLRRAEITLAELLKEQGYRTALIGKWHLNSDLGSSEEPQPQAQGFDYAYGHNAFQIPTNRNPVNIFRNGERLGVQQGFTAQLYADEAIQWLHKTGDTPFFLFLSMAEPHTSIENPDQYNEMYAQYTNGQVVPIPSGLPSPPKALLQARGPGEYYANVTYMDAQIGRVLDYLRESGLDETTIVVFASDNGPVTSDWINWWEVNAYGSTGGLRGRKHYLFEGGIRVPALLRVPGMTPPGSVSDQLVIGTDWLPTLIGLVGSTPPQDRTLDGVDALPLLLSPSVSAGQDREVLWALDSVSDLEYAFRIGDWKLFLGRDKQPRALFDLASDPLELFDVMSAHEIRVKQMMVRFEALISDIEADPLRPR